MFDDGAKRMRSSVTISDVIDAVKAFCVIYHTSRMYRTDHAVFKTAVEERMPLIERVMQGVQALSLDFYDGQIWYADIPLEPGSSVFQRISQEFGKTGIRNITLLPTIDANDLTRLISLIVGHADDIRQDGLATVLKRERIQTVRSLDTTIHRGKQGSEERAATTGAGTSGSAIRPKTGGGALWDISDTADEALETLETVDADAAAMETEDSRPRSITNFVSGVLGALTRQEADPKEAVDIIATEFEHRLEERVAVVRRKSEKKIRRLETVKELVLTELERMQIAAVIMDTEMEIIAINELARKLLKKASSTEPGSPLEEFIRSGMEKKDILLGKEKRTAHLVTVSPSGSGSEIMLITLENK